MEFGLSGCIFQGTQINPNLTWCLIYYPEELNTLEGLTDHTFFAWENESDIQVEPLVDKDNTAAESGFIPFELMDREGNQFIKWLGDGAVESNIVATPAEVKNEKVREDEICVMSAAIGGKLGHRCELD